MPDICQRGGERANMLSEQEREVNRDGRGGWQQPLTFPECPDVGSIPLLIHIILLSQHRCP